MNVIIPLTNLTFLKEFYYPAVMQPLSSSRTVLEHTVDSLGIAGQYHFVIRWEDHTKYSLGNYLNSTFPGAIVHITRDRYISGDAESVLKIPNINGPMVVFDAKSILLWNSGAFIHRINQNRADAAVTVFPHKKFPKVILGGYHNNAVSRISNRGNFALSGLYYFSEARNYFKSAPQIIKDELEMEYQPIGIDTVLNHLLEDGCRCLYHRTGVRGLNTLDQLAKFDQ